jgi:hypothetical protein
VQKESTPEAVVRFLLNLWENFKAIRLPLTTGHGEDFNWIRVVWI